MMSKKDLEALKKSFASSVPDLENESRMQHPFASKKLIVVFRKSTELSWVGEFFNELGVHDFKQVRNDRSFVIQNADDINAFQLLKKISQNKNVRYVGPYRMGN